MVAPATGLNFVLCHTQGQRYALDLTQVEGITRGEQLDRDAADEQVAGTYESPTGPVVVFRLSAMLGLDGSNQSTGPVVLTRAGNLPVGLLVDHVAHARRRPTEALFPLPDVLGLEARQTFAGLLLDQEDIIPMLDPAGLFQHPSAPRAFAPATPAMPELPRDSQTPRLIEFMLGEQQHRERPIHFALRMMHGLELLEQVPMRPIPKAHDDYPGVIVWRGQPLAIHNLAQRLGVTAPSHGTGRVLVVQPAADLAPVGLLVHPPVRILSLPIAHRVCEQPPTTKGNMVRAWFELRDRYLAVLDLRST